MDPQNPLPDPNSSPAAVPVPAPRDSRMRKCAFCECVIGPDGEYMRLSDRARTLRDLEETIRTLEKEKSLISAELAQLKAATREAAPSRGGLRL